ncbi:MAG: VOC family protein [Alphaproteobacteria bacterium]|nr:VOC family protein [Alphaproteobacteria bacterium]
MIIGFDHIVIAVRDIADGVSAYAALLDRKAPQVVVRDDVATAVFGTGNLAVELMAPVGPNAVRLSAALDDGGEGLKSLVFATADIERMRTRCERVGLAPEAIVESESGRSFRVSTERTHGVRLFFMQRREPQMRESGGISGLDHIVIRTPNAERAAALYGARLGLDMRLDREVMGRRLMFFRCGDAILEIIHDDTLSDGRDKLWGISWRLKNADEEHERLAASGLEVSDVRSGMKPGTRVFTVRDRTCNVPTLMVEPSPKRD